MHFTSLKPVTTGKNGWFQPHIDLVNLEWKIQMLNSTLGLGVIFCHLTTVPRVPTIVVGPEKLLSVRVDESSLLRTRATHKGCSGLLACFLSYIVAPC